MGKMSYHRAGKAENEMCMFGNMFLMMCPKGQADSGTSLSKVFYQLASDVGNHCKTGFQKWNRLSTHVYDFNNVKEGI